LLRVQVASGPRVKAPLPVTGTPDKKKELEDMKFPSLTTLGDFGAGGPCTIVNPATCLTSAPLLIIKEDPAIKVN